MPEETEQQQEPVEQSEPVEPRKRYLRRDDGKIMIELAPHQAVNEVSAAKLNLTQRHSGQS
jgi:hypothetical protein